MATNFPSSKDDVSTVGDGTHPTASEPLTNVPTHSTLHQNIGEAIAAIESKLGIGATTTTPSANTVLTGTSATDSQWQQVATAMIADDAVTQAKIADDAVGADQLAASAVVTASIVDDNVTQAKIAAGAVGTTELAADAVTGAKIADDAVASEHLATDSVTADAIAAGAVDTAELAADSVTAAKIAAGAVGSSEIATDAVDTAEIAANAVGASELDNSATFTAAGLIIDDGAITIRNDGSGFSSPSTSEGLFLTSHGMNASSSMYTPGVVFGTTDPQLTTTNPKYLAGIFGRANETFDDDSATGMYMEFQISGAAGGTGHQLSASGEGMLLSSSNLRPIADNTINLGSSSFAWKDVYYEGSITDTSDSRVKTLRPDDTLGLSFVNSLQATAFVKDNDSRLRQGLIAQNVAEKLAEAGLTASETAMWAEGDDDDATQRLAYLELIGPLVKAVQELTTRLEALEG